MPIPGPPQGVVRNDRGDLLTARSALMRHRTMLEEAIVDDQVRVGTPEETTVLVRGEARKAIRLALEAVEKILGGYRGTEVRGGS